MDICANGRVADVNDSYKYIIYGSGRTIPIYGLILITE